MNIKGNLNYNNIDSSQNMFEESSIPPIQDFDIVKEEIVGASGESSEPQRNYYNNSKIGSEGNIDPAATDWDVIIKIVSPETDEDTANKNLNKISLGNSNYDNMLLDGENFMEPGQVYNKDDLDNALEYLNNSQESVAEVARRFNIPRTALHDYYINSMMKDSNSKTYTLSQEEDDEVGYYLLQLAKIGNLRVKRDLPGIIKYVLDKRKKKLYANGRNIPTQGWVGSYLRSHPSIVTKVPKQFGEQRSYVSQSTIDLYFSTFETYLREEQHLDPVEFLQPGNGQRIFTCDEIGFYLSSQSYSTRPAAEKACKTFYKNVSDIENLRTVLLCISASGNVLRPIIINKGLSPTNYDSHSEIDNRYIAECSETGWITQDIFYHWLSNEFDPYLTENRIERPVLLFVESHSLSINVPAYIFAQENQIILYSLMSDAANLLQPLELGCCKQVEESYRDLLNSRVTGPTKEADPEIFPYIFIKSLENTNMPSCITSGFRETGLVPFNIDAIDKTKMTTLRSNDSVATSFSFSTQDNRPVAANNEENVMILRAELCSLKEFLEKMETILPPCFIKYYEHKLSLREPVFEHSYLIWKELKRKIGDVEKRLIKAKDLQNIKQPCVSTSRAQVKISSSPMFNSSPSLQNGLKSPYKVKTSMKADNKNKQKKVVKQVKWKGTAPTKGPKGKNIKKKDAKSSPSKIISNYHKNLNIREVRVRLSTQLPTSVKSESKGDCIVCHKVFGGNKDWIGCDCGNWCHKKCVKISPKLSNEQIRKLDFKCPNCKTKKKAAANKNKKN